MGEIRLYRQIYCFQGSGSGSTKVLLNPAGISASTTTVASSGNTIIENITPINESTGVYYADLNPTLYSSDITYELNWYLEYVTGAPIKRLPTRFRINPNVIGEKIDIEILNDPIMIEIR